MRPYVFAGGTAVVTGAGSGIGEALAYALADRGSHLVLVDQHADRLDRVVARGPARAPGLAVRTVVADLADHDATVALGTRLAAEHPETTLLVNNAGITVGGELAELSLAEVDRVLEVDLRAVVSLTHGLLPVLLAHPGRHVVVVSSIFGIFAAPGPGAVRDGEVRRPRLRRGAAPRARRTGRGDRRPPRRGRDPDRGRRPRRRGRRPGGVRRQPGPGRPACSGSRRRPRPRRSCAASSAGAAAS